MRKGIVLGCLLLALAGCAQKKPQTITIAEQYGTAYAPIAVMRELDLLKEELPSSVNVEWVKLANTAAIREAMLAGKAHIACMAIYYPSGHVRKMVPDTLTTAIHFCSPLDLIRSSGGSPNKIVRKL